MTNTNNQPEQAAELRRQAEEIASKKAVSAPEDLKAMSPEEMRHLLHELQVYQIELEMQNEELCRAQSALDAERTRYFDLYDLAPVGYCTVSDKGLILMTNLYAATLLGVARGELIKQPFTRFILKEDQDIYYLLRKLLFETGQQQTAKLRSRRPGTERPTLWRLPTTAWDCPKTWTGRTRRPWACCWSRCSVITDPALLDTEASELIQLGNERLLFIDDEEILAEMGKNMLERLGYRVTVRTSSLEALTTFQNQPDQFDLVITDQTMPGITGSDLARRMLQIRPGVPIILCTGYSNLISAEKARSLGIKGFAMKPLAKKDIAALIRKALDGERLSG